MKYTITGDYKGEQANFDLEVDNEEMLRKHIKDNFDNDPDWLIMGWVVATYVPPSIEKDCNKLPKVLDNN